MTTEQMDEVDDYKPGEDWIKSHHPELYSTDEGQRFQITVRRTIWDTSGTKTLYKASILDRKKSKSDDVEPKYNVQDIKTAIGRRISEIKMQDAVDEPLVYYRD